MKDKKANTTDDTINALKWDVLEFKELKEKNSQLLSEVQLFKSIEMQHEHSTNISPHEIEEFKIALKQYVKDISMKKRQAASHLMIFMIADELRNMKPYAIPIRVLPYKSITDSMLRDLRDELKNTVTKIGM